MNSYTVVLVIEKNDDIRELIAERMKSDHSCRVFAADSAQQALRWLSLLHFDLVICELEQTPLRGDEFYNQFRIFSNSPFILTGHSNNYDRQNKEKFVFIEDKNLNRITEVAGNYLTTLITADEAC